MESRWYPIGFALYSSGDSGRICRSFISEEGQAVGTRDPRPISFCSHAGLFLNRVASRLFGCDRFGAIHLFPVLERISYSDASRKKITSVCQEPRSYFSDALHLSDELRFCQ